MASLWHDRVERALRHRDVRTITKTCAHLLAEDPGGGEPLLPAAAPPEAARPPPERRVYDLCQGFRTACRIS